MDIIIRHEQEKDFREVENMTREAFWNLHVPGCDEHYLLHSMRNHPDFVHELNFVAEYHGQIIGNIVYTKSYLQSEEGERMDTLTFGPVAVLPEFQRQGIGSLLINHTFNLVRDKGISLIIIYGHPHNYVKHGFRNGIDFHISDNEGRYPLGLLVKELLPGFNKVKKWIFQCSDVYELDEKKAEIFDQTFPFKKKDIRYSQVEFAMACRAFLE